MTTGSCLHPTYFWVPSSAARDLKQGACGLSRVRLFVTPWPIAHQAPLRNTGSGLALPSPGDLHDPGIKPTSLVPPALTGGFLTVDVTWEVPNSGT